MKIRTNVRIKIEERSGEMVKKVYCPKCGHLEKNLYLEETDGWFLCSHCHTQVKIETENQGNRIDQETVRSESERVPI